MSELPSVTVRAYRPGDAATLVQVFFEAVHQFACTHYSEDQLQAWAPAVPDPARWAERMAARQTFVAEVNQALVGFLEIDLDGHIHMLYRSPSATGLGTAALLYESAERWARNSGIQRLTAEVSLSAQLFFETRGFAAGGLELVERDGITLPRQKMFKDLA